MLIAAACTSAPPVMIPTLVELPPPTDAPPASHTPTALIPSRTPSATDTPTEAPTSTVTPSMTPSATATSPATWTPTALPTTAAPATVTLTPSETITDTITPTLTPSFTASPEIGAFGALVDLAGRVTVLPVETRFSPPTQTALAIARAQLASLTPPGSSAFITAGDGLQVATLPPGVSISTGPTANVGGSVVIVSTAVGGIGGGAATPLPPPVICQFPPPPTLGALLNTDAALANALGCPVGAPPVTASIGAASQVFERGVMIYTANPLGGLGSIYALTNDGRYRRFDDPFVPGVDPESTGESIPPGFVEPVRGFGEVWRVNLDLRGTLGYALAAEQGDTATTLDFNRGRAIFVPLRGVTYILIDDAPGANAGSWRALTGGF